MSQHTELQDTIICPWCTHRVREGDLCDYRDGEQECESCGKPIKVTIDYRDPLYSTETVVTFSLHQPGCAIRAGEYCNCQQRG